MDYHLSNQTAFVAAGAHGIGEAIANLLAQEGARVVVADQDEAALARTRRAMARHVAADLATAPASTTAVADVRRRSAARPTSSSTISASATRRRSRTRPTSSGRGRSRST